MLKLYIILFKIKLYARINIDNRKYFLPRAKIGNYNILTNGRNFYDQPINDLIKQ